VANPGSIIEALSAVGVAMTNLSSDITVSAAMHPDAGALRCDGATTTYSALAGDVARFADYLVDSGMKPGDPVGVMLPNRPDFVAAFYGVLQAGGVVVPMNPAQSVRAVEYYLTIADARMLFFANRRAAATTVAALTAGAQPIRVGKHGIARLAAHFAGRAQPVSRAADDIAILLPALGASGPPTIVQLTHADLISNKALAGQGLLGVGHHDVVMACLPLFEGFGMTCAMAAAMSAGATLVLPPRFHPRTALETIAAERVTLFEAVPGMYTAMLRVADAQDVEVDSLRVCISVGAPLAAEVLRRFEERFGCIVLEGYGMSQISPVGPPQQRGAARTLGSVGTPISDERTGTADDIRSEPRAPVRGTRPNPGPHGARYRRD
jgi:long-chain acyl-CoA synthetase